MVDLAPLVSLASSVIGPFLGALAALHLQSRQHAERVSCFVDWSMDWDERDGPSSSCYVGVHNRSTQPIAVHGLRYIRNGIFSTDPSEGTALMHDDPFDIGFPYLVQAGEIKSLYIDDEMASALLAKIGRARDLLSRITGRPRIFIEVRTTAGTRIRTSAEPALPWDRRLRSARFA